MTRFAEDSSSMTEQLNQIAMNSFERHNAREALLKAQILVDLLFAALSHVSAVAAMTKRGTVVLVRRSRRFLFGYGKKQRRLARV